MAADVGVAADVEVTAEGVAAKDRGVAENNGMAPVSPDVSGLQMKHLYSSYSSSSINLQVHGQF